MATSIAHAFAGVACLAVVRIVYPRAPLRLSLWACFWAAFAGCLPDADVVPGILFADSPTRWHSEGTHSLAFVLLSAALFWAFGKKLGEARFYATAVCFFAVLSHILIDLVTGPSWGPHQSFGVPMLWPLDDTRWQTPFTLFRGVQHGSVAIWFNSRNLTTALSEFLVGAPVLMVLLLRVRKLENGPATKI